MQRNSMRMLRRIIPLFTIVSLLCATCPARVLAMSTQKEIALGQSYDQQIVSSSVVETDPLLNAYVQGIAGNLWDQVARKDLPYNVKIMKDSQVNSFATMGGFIYINEGLIDFVQSDDELAGVMGHETGHIERRHVLTSNSKAELIQLLFGIASMFSPIIYAFGGLAEEGLIMKISREDEIQADRYGLQLMSRGGYDPESMETVASRRPRRRARRCGQQIPRGSSRSRRARLTLNGLSGTRSYHGDADGKTRAGLQRRRPRSLLICTDTARPSPQERSTKLGGPAGLGQSELALGLPNKSEQTLAEAAQLGSPATRATANQRIAALRKMEEQKVTLTRPDPPNLQAAVEAAADAHVQNATEIKARAAEGKDQRSPCKAGSRPSNTRCRTSAESIFAVDRAWKRLSRISRQWPVR